VTAAGPAEAKGGRVVEAASRLVDLAALAFRYRLAQDAPVLGQNRAVALPELVEQPRRPLDVGEQEGNSPRSGARPSARPSLRPSASGPLLACDHLTKLTSFVVTTADGKLVGAALREEAKKALAQR